MPWLNSDAANIARRIVESKAIMLEVAAANDLAQHDGKNQYDAQSIQKLEDARRYRHFISVLNEITKDKQHNTITITHV